MSSPKFTLLCAVYNEVDYIEQAIKSCRSQTFTDWELLVMDGGSTDGTLSFIESLEDLRVRIVSRSDNGLYDALNKGLTEAKGIFVGILHANDVLADPDVLVTVLKLIEPRTDYIYGSVSFVAPNSERVVRVWRGYNFYGKFKHTGIVPPHTSTFVRLSLIRQIGLYDVNFKISADYDFLMRVQSAARAFNCTLDTLVVMREGGLSTSWSCVRRKISEDFVILRRYVSCAACALFLKWSVKMTQRFTR